MKILMVGDVVGRPGRRILRESLPRLTEEHQPDLIVVNAENAAGGFGVTESVLHELLDNTLIDILTSGNHIWDKSEALRLIEREPRLLRPHNYPARTPGLGWAVSRAANGIEVGVVNVMGKVFMKPTLSCPFICVDQLLDETSDIPKVIVVDFHAEATSEKVAMGWHLDGRVSAVVGTHTHVPTADERILPHGTAYISDLGMTGCYNSVLGMNKEKVINHFLGQMPQGFEPAKGLSILSGVIVDTDEATGKSRSLERIEIKESEGQML